MSKFHRCKAADESRPTSNEGSGSRYSPENHLTKSPRIVSFQDPSTERDTLMDYHKRKIENQEYV